MVGYKENRSICTFCFICNSAALFEVIQWGEGVQQATLHKALRRTPLLSNFICCVFSSLAVTKELTFVSSLLLHIAVIYQL